MRIDPRRAVLAGIAVALALRVGYAAHAWRNIPTSSDDYETIALSLLERGEYSTAPGTPTAIREPVYPLLIAAAYAPFGRRPWIVLALQVLLGVATCLVAQRLALRLFDKRVGLAVLWVCALHPQLIYYTAYFFRDTLLAFLFSVLCLASVDWSAAAGDPRGDAAAKEGGWTAAALGLANSAHLPAVALAGAALWLVAPKPVRRRRALYYFAPLLLAFGLWSLRNWRAFGAFVPGSTHGGPEFYQALVVPPADLGTPRQTEILSADPDWLAAEPLGELAQSQVLTKAAFRWIGTHPGLYLSRAVAGFAKFWRPWPYKRAYPHSYALLLAASLLSDAWIVPLGLFGLWMCRRRWRQAPAVWTGALGLTAVYGAVHAVIRYRLPLVPPMIVFAVAAAANMKLVNRTMSPDVRPT